MSAKEVYSAKKEKNFNGTKAKYSPNPTVPDKKEVKLRRKESEKVKQPGDSSRKSVLGRLFHNLVDSDDSRKKGALADAKKKRTSRNPDGSVGSLDLPEHGFVLPNSQALSRDSQPVSNVKLRSLTLANQSRENRNRWSSYDVNGFNFTDGALPQRALPQNSSNLSHRWQSEETLSVSPSADPKFSKIADSFVAHSDMAKQPVAMRKHAQLLQSIEKANADRANWSEKATEPPGGHESNGWLITATQMGEDLQKKDANTASEISEQKQNKLPNTSSSSKLVGADTNTDTKPDCGSSLSSDAIVLLDEMSKQINKALAEKRKILSHLFETSEEDMDHLIEKDVDLSKDLNVRKMILISLLHSDHLTSAINSTLVPPKNMSSDSTGNKDVSIAKGDKPHDKKIPDHSSRSLHDAALRLHNHLSLLVQLVNKDVEENSQIKKDLEDSQKQLAGMNAFKDSTTAPSDIVTEMLSNDSDVSCPGHVHSFTDLHGQAVGGTRNLEKNKTEQKEPKIEEDSRKIEKTDTDLGSDDMSFKNPEGIKAVEVLSANKAEIHVIEQIPDDTYLNLLQPMIDSVKPLDNVTKQPFEVTVRYESTLDKSDLLHMAIPDQPVSFVPSQTFEISDHQYVLPDELKVNDEESQSVSDTSGAMCLRKPTDAEDLMKPTDAEDEVDLYSTDRMFRNLESIPEDDDRFICCDVEQIPADKVESQEVFEDDKQIATTVGDGEIKLKMKNLSNEAADVLPSVQCSNDDDDDDDDNSSEEDRLTVEDDATYNSEDNIQSNFEDDVQSDLADGSHSKENEFQSNIDGVHSRANESVPCVDSNSQSDMHAPVYEFEDTVQSDTENCKASAIDAIKEDDKCSDENHLSRLSESMVQKFSEPGSGNVQRVMILEPVDQMSMDKQSISENTLQCTVKEEGNLIDLGLPNNSVAGLHLEYKDMIQSDVDITDTSLTEDSAVL